MKNIPAVNEGDDEWSNESKRTFRTLRLGRRYGIKYLKKKITWKMFLNLMFLFLVFMS